MAGSGDATVVRLVKEVRAHRALLNIVGAWFENATWLLVDHLDGRWNEHADDTGVAPRDIIAALEAFKKEGSAKDDEDEPPSP